MALTQGTPDGASQAMGLFRRVTEMRPDYPDGWGQLALNYAGAAISGSPQEATAMRTRATDAANRALALDSDNPYARIALFSLSPRMSKWREGETLLRGLVARYPSNEVAWSYLSIILFNVGRIRESADIQQARWGRILPDPGAAYARVIAFWACNRLDEADRAMRDATSLFPTHYAVWFTRFYLLLYTGRAAEALAMGLDVDKRPAGIPDWNFDMIIDVARAMISRAPADIDRVVATHLERSRTGAGFAENAMQFCSALGRVDTAFQLADAYFFGRGFQIAEMRFSPEQRIYSRTTHRRTAMLFLPSTAAMRADPRFDKLVGELGLTKYWTETRSQPDYKRYA